MRAVVRGGSTGVLPCDPTAESIHLTLFFHRAASLFSHQFLPFIAKEGGWKMDKQPHNNSKDKLRACLAMILGETCARLTSGRGRVYYEDGTEL